MALVKCLLRREGGTVVMLDGVEYRFVLNAGGEHCCEVADDEHLDTLLAISEAYALVEPVEPKKPKKKAVAKAEADDLDVEE